MTDDLSKPLIDIARAGGGASGKPDYFDQDFTVTLTFRDWAHVAGVLSAAIERLSGDSAARARITRLHDKIRRQSVDGARAALAKAGAA